MRHLRAAVFVLPLALAAAGCASTSAAAQGGDGTSSAANAAEASVPPVGSAPPPPSAAGAAPAPVEPDIAFGRTLQSLDERADEYLRLAGATGEDVRGRRTILAASIESDVTRHADRLLAIAADPREDVNRRIAVKALGFSKDPRAMGTLSRVLESRSDTHLMTSAAYGLARISDPATPIPPLLAAAQHPDRDVRNNALLALWHVLDARTDKGAAPLEGDLRERTLETIENALFDPEEALVRGNAAAAMGALGDPRGVDPLMNLLRDTSPFVRTQTALSLGKLGDRRAIPALVEVIDESPKGTVRDAVILGLSSLIEKLGFTVPTSLPDDERSWKGFVERTAGFSFDPPNLRRR